MIRCKFGEASHKSVSIKMNSQCFHNCSNIALSMNSLYLHTRGSAIHCNGSRHKTNTNFEAKCNIIFVSVGLTKPSLCATFVAFQPQKKQDAKCHACYGLQKSSCKASAFFVSGLVLSQTMHSLWRNTYLRITRRIPTRADVCVYVYMYTQYVALMYLVFMCIHTVGLHTCKLTHICMWGIGTANIWFEDAF